MKRQFSIESIDYSSYIAKQIYNFFPDEKKVDKTHLKKCISNSFECIDYCFTRIK
jgi:hypothetical protein